MHARAQAATTCIHVPRLRPYAFRWFSYDEGRLPVRLSQREVALRLDAMGGLEQLRFNEYDRGDMHPEAFREFLPHWYARALAPPRARARTRCVLRRRLTRRLTRRAALCPLRRLTRRAPLRRPPSQGARWSRWSTGRSSSYERCCSRASASLSTTTACCTAARASSTPRERSAR